MMMQQITSDEMELALNTDMSNSRFHPKRIQYNIAKLIEQKTGVNLKECHEEKILKK